MTAGDSQSRNRLFRRKANPPSFASSERQKCHNFAYRVTFASKLL